MRVTDERPENDMDKVLHANRAKANTGMELVKEDGERIAYVMPVEPGTEPGQVVRWEGGTYLKVNGLRNVWRLTPVTAVTEVS